jgi:hypothetical protein
LVGALRATSIYRRNGNHSRDRIIVSRISPWLAWLAGT